MTLRNDIRTATVSEAQRTFVLAKTYQSLAQYFAFWEYSAFAKSDLDAEFSVFVQVCAAVAERGVFALHLTRFLSRLNNLHTTYSDPLFSCPGGPNGASRTDTACYSRYVDRNGKAR